VVMDWNLLRKLAERRIQEAMERGDFDNLPGEGRPLQWRESPLAPPEWHLAFYVLERAGLAPEWIMRDAEIRAGLAALERKREQERVWVEGRRDAMAAMSPEERATERDRLRQVQAHTWERMRQSIVKLNRNIADFNLIVPMVWLQRCPLDLAEEEAALRAAWDNLDVEEVV